ncbi:MAG: BMC domain-containing protein [Gemmatimonadetes bacterium]|nr:BMC domain-containing protein [Gemmatimonadota bacterium]
MAAIGLIETRGLVGVIEAADAAVKSAPVELLGIKPIGGGLVSTHFRGEVAAVQVAVQAGVEAALKVSQVISHRVIPAPHLDVENKLLHKYQAASPPAQPPPDELEDLPVTRLRQLVRQLPDAQLKGRQVSRANKETLLRELRRASAPDT